MKKTTTVIWMAMAIIAFTFNLLGAEPQTAREILSRPILARVEFDEVGLKSVIRHLAQRPECSELSLSYGFAPNLRDTSITISCREKSLYQILNYICLQNKLQFSFKDNFLYFFNDTKKYRYSQTTTGNSTIDAKLSENLLPTVEFSEASYSKALNFLNKKTEDFIFLWEGDENHERLYQINCSLSSVNLLSVIREICKQANLQFRHVEGALVFSKIDNAILAEKEFNLGKEFYSQKNYEAAIDHFALSSAYGHVEASYMLGVMNFRGEGIPVNKFEAYVCFQNAASKNHVLAQYNLGFMYYKGECIEKDTEEAMKWFSKAADQGDPDAQYLLGLGYLEGEGVEKNRNEAIKWLRAAAKQEHKGALLALEKLGVEREKLIAVMGYQGEKAFMTAENYKKYKEDFAKAEKAGTGMKFLREIDLSKYSVKVERPTASKPVYKDDRQKQEVEALRVLAEKGDASAQKYLGNYYYSSGQRATAVQWYERAGNGGDIEAQYLLGEHYLSERDTAKARYWFSKAAASGDKEAARALKYMAK